MMEFSLFGIPYVSQIGTIAPCPDFSVCVSVLKEDPVDNLILLLFRQEQTSVGSSEMLSTRCVSAGCSWEPFIHFPGTTTMQEPGWGSHCSCCRCINKYQITAYFKITEVFPDLSWRPPGHSCFWISTKFRTPRLSITLNSTISFTSWRHFFFFGQEKVFSSSCIELQYNMFPCLTEYWVGILLKPSLINQCCIGAYW